MSSSAEALHPSPPSTLAEQQTPAVAEDGSTSSSSNQASSCAPGLEFGGGAQQDAASSSAAKPRVFKMSDEFLMFKFKIEMCSRKDRWGCRGQGGSLCRAKP